MSDAPFFNLQAKSGPASHAVLLREAIRKRQVVQFSYQNSDGEKSIRQVHPLVVWTLDEGWMFSAWCQLRQDFRTFRHDRISNMTLTGEVFENDETTGLQAFMALEECEAHGH